MHQFYVVCPFLYSFVIQLYIWTVSCLIMCTICTSATLGIFWVLAPLSVGTQIFIHWLVDHRRTKTGWSYVLIYIGTSVARLSCELKEQVLRTELKDCCSQLTTSLVIPFTIHYIYLSFPTTLIIFRSMMISVISRAYITHDIVTVKKKEFDLMSPLKMALPSFSSS